MVKFLKMFRPFINEAERHPHGHDECREKRGYDGEIDRHERRARILPGTQHDQAFEADRSLLIELPGKRGASVRALQARHERQSASAAHPEQGLKKRREQELRDIESAVVREHCEDPHRRHDAGKERDGIEKPLPRARAAPPGERRAAHLAEPPEQRCEIQGTEELPGLGRPVEDAGEKAKRKRERHPCAQ